MAVDLDGDSEDQPPQGSTEPPHTELLDDLLVPRDSRIQPIVSIVLPTLNEEDGIGPCITAIKTALDELDVPGEIIVSDSSTDRTAEIARDHGALVVEPDKPGYGYAYRYGFQFARGEYIVMGDADTTYDFETIPELLKPLLRDEADIVLGSRFAGEIKPGAMPPLHQYIGNPLLTKFLNVFYDAGVSDAHSGFRVFTRDVLTELSLQSDGMEFASEMVMQAAMSDLRIEEVPIVYHEREGEETLDSLNDGWRHVKFMLTNAPTYLFTVPGFIFGLIGVFIMLVSLTGQQYVDIKFSTYTMVAGSLLTILGYQVGSLAVFCSVATNPIREPADPITRWICENFSLEQGASVGVGLFSVGAVAGTYMIVQWISSGYTVRPPITWLLITFTVVVLGAQTVFYSFFLSMLAEDKTYDQDSIAGTADLATDIEGKFETDEADSAATTDD